MTSVFIDGAAGTTGLDIHERLARRPDLTVVTLDDHRRKDARARAEALNDADFVILCLPDDAAREAVTLIRSDRVRVIDASSAHRVAPGWAYGFPELEPDGAERIAAARRVANPGCYPTGFLALVRPLVRAGLLPTDWPTTVNAVSGYSGGGKVMIAEYEGSAPPAFRAYALDLAHKHVPEMTTHAGLIHPPVFAPAVAAVRQGMIVEVPLSLAALPQRPTLAALREVIGHAYAGQALIRVAADDGATVSIEEHAGSDRMTLRVRGNDVTGQARLIATIDNLGKGAGGAAVQNLNLMAGLDPLAGLVI